MAFSACDTGSRRAIGGLAGRPVSGRRAGGVIARAVLYPVSPVVAAIWRAAGASGRDGEAFPGGQSTLQTLGLLWKIAKHYLQNWICNLHFAKCASGARYKPRWRSGGTHRGFIPGRCSRAEVWAADVLGETGSETLSGPGENLQWRQATCLTAS